MNLSFILIILGVAATVGLAIAIVKYVPVKFTKLVSLGLFLISILLIVLIFRGINEPIKFHKDKKVIYVEVIDRLKTIAKAEEAYESVYHKFTDNKDTLMAFVQNGSVPVMETFTEVQIVDTGNGITKEVEQRVSKKVGEKSVKDDILKGKDVANMFKIPHTKGEEFKIDTALRYREEIQATVSCFEIKIKKSLVLSELPQHLVKQEMEALGGDEIPGRYISVGSLSEKTTAGNWPPLFDIAVDGEQK